MATTNPFTYLKETVNPIVEAMPDDAATVSDPILDLFDFEDVKGLQMPESGEVEIYQFKSRPAVVIGTKWAYESGTRGINQGKIKFLKLTIQMRISEDELDRMMQNGTNSLVERGIRTQRRESIAYLKTQLQKLTIDAWAGVTTDGEYVSAFKSVLAGSSGNTLGNPNDLNASAGTALDLDAVILSGASETSTNVIRISNEIRKGMIKIDAITKVALPVGQIYLGVDPITMAILKTQHDLQDVTTKTRSPNTIYNDLVNAGIQPVESVYFSPSYAGTTDTAANMCAFADPKQNFVIYRVLPPEGSGWTDWAKEPTTEAGRTTYSFERHKKVEFGCQAQAYWINTSATAGALYKAVFWLHLKPYKV